MTQRFIRYTRGPDELWLGQRHLVRGVSVPVDDDEAGQALLPARIDEYGFEESDGPGTGVVVTELQGE